MKVLCKNCIHYGICEYNTVTDKEIDCKDFKQRVTKETLQELEDILSKMGIAAKDEEGNYRLGGDVLNDIYEYIKMKF